MLTSFNYEYDLAAYFGALLLRIPIFIRLETQDRSFERSAIRSGLRSILYRLLYRGVDQAFYIGELNREHYLRHGLRDRQLYRVPYCVPDPFRDMPLQEKQNRRTDLRERMGVKPSECLVSFFGKLIPKKNPDLLIEAYGLLDNDLRNRIRILYVGSGEMEKELRTKSHGVGCQAQFAGFINQSALPDYYLASDIVILPSRRAGETWGLVVNESLHAGCGVIVSEAVGCSAEFGEWERVRVIPVGNATACASAILELATKDRSFNWCSEKMEAYSLETAATTLAGNISMTRHDNPGQSRNSLL